MFFFPVGVFLTISFIKENGGEVEEVKNRFQFLIPKDDDLNILFVNSNQLEGRNVADVFLIFKVSAHDNALALLSVPGSTKMVFQNKIANLKNFFEYGGMSCVKKALENFLAIQIDRTVQATDESVKGVVNCLGGLKLCAADEHEPLFENLPVVGGKKVVGGEFFSKILKEDPIKAFLLLKNVFYEPINLSRFFAYFANMFVSNITAYDFETRKKGFEEMISKKSAVVVLPKLEVKNFEGRHVLTCLSRQSCSRAFKKQ